MNPLHEPESIGICERCGETCVPRYHVHSDELDLTVCDSCAREAMRLGRGGEGEVFVEAIQ